MEAQETELLDQCREFVAKAMKRFADNDIAAIKVSDLRKIDKLLNPIPEGFDLCGHLSAPSRSNPVAAAFAVRARAQ